ncbi:hypothetical protein SS50377_26896 [Spironucleus salmonicida]|uniref:Uncharacterized protein n=1 Tax=Spironucleus salmonicida TaxID=348837 RepID=A0A9P8LMG6_9EUKA|nr:hypothetical protein SS50377_26896 [Spironucleus salmonicida]
MLDNYNYLPKTISFIACDSLVADFVEIAPCLGRDSTILRVPGGGDRLLPAGSPARKILHHASVCLFVLCRAALPRHWTYNRGCIESVPARQNIRARGLARGSPLSGTVGRWDPAQRHPALQSRTGIPDWRTGRSERPCHSGPRAALAFSTRQERRSDKELYQGAIQQGRQQQPFSAIMPFMPLNTVKDDNYFLAFMEVMFSFDIVVQSKAHAAKLYLEARERKVIQNTDRFMKRVAEVYSELLGTKPINYKQAAQYFQKTFKRHAANFDPAKLM